MVKLRCEHWRWKGTSLDEVTLNSEEIKPTVLVIIKLRLSEGVLSQSDSQSVKKSVKYFLKNFISNLMQRFKVDLKIFLGLAMVNQCCHAVGK